MTAGGRPRIRSKRQAVNLLVADQAADRVKWKAAGQEYVARLAESVAQTPALAAVVALHRPVVNDDDDSLDCASCGDCCNGAELFPCETMRAIIAHHGEVPPPAPPERHLEDYWPDPYVTVTFAHLSELAYGDEPFIVRGGQQLTLRHSVASHYKSRLVTTSQQRVEAMR